MKITNILKLTNQKFLNLFLTNYVDNKGQEKKWIHCSRHSEPRKEIKGADAVMIVPFLRTEGSHGCVHELILTKQFRPPIQDYEVAFPAGLVDKEEEINEAASRELFEEANLSIRKVIHQTPVFYNSAGMTDESSCVVYAEVEGEPSSENQEEDEDIQILRFDKMTINQIINKGPISKFSAKTWLILQMINQGGFMGYMG